MSANFLAAGQRLQQHFSQTIARSDRQAKLVFQFLQAERPAPGFGILHASSDDKVGCLLQMGLHDGLSLRLIGCVASAGMSLCLDQHIVCLVPAQHQQAVVNTIRLAYQLAVPFVDMQLLILDGTCNICGERVRTAREIQGLSQEALAARIQLNGHSLAQKAISRIEMGLRVVPDYEIPLLADALNVDPLWLIGLTNQQK